MCSVRSVFLALVGVLILTVPVIAEVIDVRDAPGGNRLLVIDDNDIRREPGGDRLLFIDGNDIRPSPGGDRLLFIDGDDIRPAPGDVRLLFIDGQDIRRKPGSDRLLFIDGKDIRREPGGDRLFYIDGEPSAAQLIAVLYQLKPELFKLSDDELKALRDEMAANRAESEKAFDEALIGEMTVLNSNLKDWGSGTIKTTRGKDGYVYTEMKLGEQSLLGIGVEQNVNGYTGLLFTATPDGAAALAVYELKGDELVGKWIPTNAALNGAESLGEETLKGSTELTGQYTITSAKAPNGGAAYSGTLTIDKLEVQDAHHAVFGNDCVSLTWDLAGLKVSGIGYVYRITEAKDGQETKRTFLVAAAGSKQPLLVGAVLKESGTSIKSIDFITDAKQAGYFVVSK